MGGCDRDGGEKPKPEPQEININWIIPGGKNQELQDVHANPGDTLTFTWNGFHNVYLLKECGGEWDDFTCPASQAVWDEGENLGDGSPVSYMIPDDMKPGDSLCFACEVGQHCRAGQYTTVTIKGGDKQCCKAMIADCLACVAGQTKDEFCKNQEKEVTGCPAKGGDDEPFESLDDLKAFCATADEDACKLCFGKFKSVRGKTKCTVKEKKLKKMKCKKVKDLGFCARIGCTVSKKRNKCAGKPNLK